MSTKRILLVEDNEGQKLYLHHLLERTGCYNVTSVNNGLEAVNFLNNNTKIIPNIIITDIVMPEINGYELSNFVRNNFSGIFVIIITGADNSYIGESFNSGAIDYLSKPINELELLARVKNVIRLQRAERILKKTILKLKTTNKILKKNSITDDLTGIHNRRYVIEQLKLKIYKFNRYKQPLSLVLVDIDNFKNINDTFGHDAGDSVLRKISNYVKESIRMSDVFGRFGGDEFLIIFSNTSKSEAVQKFNKIILEIKDFTFDFASDISVTLSAGIVEYQSSYTEKDFLSFADTMLYKAKKNGKNQVLCQ